MHLKKHISKRELDLPVLEFPKIFKRIINDKSVISLGPGEPDFVTPKPLLDYASRMLKKGQGTHYSEPQGNLDLRKAITRKLKKENKIIASPEQILVTCGSQEALFSALLTTIDPGEKVIVTSPGYVGYVPAIELVNGKPVFLKTDEEDDFGIDPDRLKKLVDKKTRAIIINTPCNPTGNVISKKCMEEIADIAIDKDLLILSDEAYEDIIYDKKHISIASLNGMKKHVLSFHTFSKSYAMCGFRLGYVSGPEKIIKSMIKPHHYVTLTAPHISQLMGVKALSLPGKYLDSMNKEYRRRRDMIVKRLNNLGLHTCTPAGAFYTFSNIARYSKNSSKFSRMLLDKAKVAVIPGTEFGPHGEGYIRCSFATDYKLIEKAMDKIEGVLG